MKLIVTDRLGATTDLSTGRSVPGLHNSSNTYPRGSVGLSISGLTISSATGFMLNPAPAPVPIDDNPYRWIILLYDSDHEWTQSETAEYNEYLSTLSVGNAYSWAITMLYLPDHIWSAEETEAYDSYIATLFPDGLPAYDTIDFDELFDDPDHVWTEQENILLSHYEYFGV